MNYRFTRAVKDFVLANEIKISAGAFVDTLNTMMENYKENFYVMMNLLGSHDTERLASLAVNPDGQYDHKGNARDNKNFDVRKPNDVEYKRIKLAYGIQFTIPGAPHVYYGDEAGMWGGDDPDCRKPAVWQNIEYEPETTHPFSNVRSIDSVKFGQAMFDWIKKLAYIRSNNKVLSLGEIKFEIIDHDKDIIAYKRFLNSEEIIIIINRNGSNYNIDLNKVELFTDKKKMNDLITGISFEPMKNSLVLGPYQIMILK
jgi:glycosidase